MLNLIFLDKLAKISLTSNSHVFAFFFFFFNWDLLSGLGRTLATGNLVVAVPF